VEIMEIERRKSMNLFEHACERREEEIDREWE